MGITFDFFKAGYGDAILVCTDEGTNILIDGGLVKSYKEIKKSKKIDKLKKLDLVVLTHIDSDHINGLIYMLRKDSKNRKKIKKLWFNTEDFKVADSDTEKGFGQSMAFSALIKEHGIVHVNGMFLTQNAKELDPFTFNELELILLSPMKSDVEKLNEDFKKYIEELDETKDSEKSSKSCIDERDIEMLAKEFSSELKKGNDIPPKDSVPNLSSIAFILKYYDIKREKSLSFLFLADAGIDVINKSLESLGYSEENPLEVEFVKLSHHGSKNSINHKFLNIVKTNRYVTLTNCSKFQHPDKETLSFIIMNHFNEERELTFSFNYKDIIGKKISKDEEEKYKFRAEYTPFMRYSIDE